MGSTSLVTDSAGKLYEHIQYFATGETWVQDASNTQRTSYLFAEGAGTTKEPVPGLAFCPTA